MPRKHKTPPTDPNGVQDFRHEQARRKNNPPAGIKKFYRSSYASPDAI
jgi:hypothetical protein